MTDPTVLREARAEAREQIAAEDAADRLLPAVVSGLDLDMMRQAAPVLRARLIDLLRDSARQLREARGTVVTPEDTYDTVRRLVAAGEVFRQWSQAFAEAAKEADALTAEEAAIANGEQDGVPNGSLFVPDGEGQRIAIRNDWKSGGDTWDVGSLVGWLAEDTVAELGSRGPDDEPLWGADEMRQVARDSMDRLLALGRYTPQATPLNELRRKLAERGRDADAAVIAQVRSKAPRTYAGVKITREDAK